MEVLLEILKAHFVLVNLGVLVAVLYLVQGYLLPYCLEHYQNVLGHQVALLLPVQLIKQVQQLLLYLLWLGRLLVSSLKVCLCESIGQASKRFTLPVYSGEDVLESLKRDLLLFREVPEHFLDLII